MQFQHGHLSPTQLRRLDRISEGDRQWFERHPARSFRFRPFARGEEPPFPYDGPRLTHTIVRQVAPGVRLRVPVALRRGDYLNAETVCRELWRQAAARWRLQNGRTLDEIAALMAESVRERPGENR